MRLLRFLRLPALLRLLRPLISFVSFSYSLTSSAALLDGGLWGGYAFLCFCFALQALRRGAVEHPCQITDGHFFHAPHPVFRHAKAESVLSHGGCIHFQHHRHL